MNKTEHEIIRFIKEKNLISEGDRILVALSGGPDSVFLLTFLNKFRRKYRIEIGAFHLNHMLRKAADKDERFCRNLCLEKGIPFFSYSADVKKEAAKKGISLEEAGRNIRYALLEKTAVENSFSKIAMGHNLNDNTETVLLNLVKGTGLRGISGIPVSRGRIIRPLLTTTKKDIEDFLQKDGLNFVSDKSNLQNNFERNFLRNKIIPLLRKRLNPNLDLAVYRSSENFRNIATWLEKRISQLAEKVSLRDEGFRIDLTELKKQDPELIPEILKFILERNFIIQPSFKDIRSIISLIDNEAGKSCSIPGKLKITRERTFLEITGKKEFQSAECMLRPGGHCKAGRKTLFIEDWTGSPEFSTDRNVEFIDGEKVGNEFIVRHWIAGDRFMPIGMDGTVKVSDFLNSLKIPSSEKEEKLVLTTVDDEIIWVIGYRISEKFKIKMDSRRILRLCLK